VSPQPLTSVEYIAGVYCLITTPHPPMLSVSKYAVFRDLRGVPPRKYLILRDLFTEIRKQKA
jgi:hypothetical protein